jgi:hypothetical protein
MAYNNNIPQPGDNLSTSQGQILSNFFSANSIFGKNHYAFNDTSGNAGFHSTITLVEQTSPLAPLADQIAIYAQANATSGKTRLFMQQENTGGVIQMSTVDPTNTPSANGCSGQTFLPGTSAGAYLFQFGSATWNNISGTVTVTFSTAFSQVPLVVASTNSGMRIVASNPVSATQVTFNVSPANPAGQVNWMAIGLIDS